MGGVGRAVGKEHRSAVDEPSLVTPSKFSHVMHSLAGMEVPRRGQRTDVSICRWVAPSVRRTRT